MHIIIGVPGAGKTTLATQVSEKTGIQLVNFGDVMYDIAKINGFKGTKDQLRSDMSVDDLEHYQIRAFDKIIQMDRKLPKGIMVDTHAFIPLGNGLYQNGFPYKVRDTLKGHVDMWVFVWASADILVDRIMKDTKRSREDMYDLESVRYLINLERSCVVGYTIATGGFYLDVNNDGPKGNKVDTVVEALSR